MVSCVTTYTFALKIPEIRKPLLSLGVPALWGLLTTLGVRILQCHFLWPFPVEHCGPQARAPSVCGGRGSLSSPQAAQSPHRSDSPLGHTLRVSGTGPNVCPQCLPLPDVYSENLNVVGILTL